MEALLGVCLLKICFFYCITQNIQLRFNLFFFIIFLIFVVLINISIFNDLLWKIKMDIYLGAVLK